MKQEESNETIKEKRGGIQFEIVRLQSIIIDSMKRFTLTISMVLEIVLMLHMFRAPFSYLKSLLINPTWAYIPLFNYITPAYYEIYLNPFGYLCVLIIILIVMILYIIGVILLIITQKHSKISKTLAKIIRIKLQIFSTILFSSIVKTVLTIFHCQSPNVSTQNQQTEFKCLYEGPYWLKLFSITVLGIFVLIISLQSYLKFQFYAHQTKQSLLRKSQQWLPLLLWFHVIIQIIAITQTQLVLLLIMNIIPIVMIIHLFFVEQTVTTISKKVCQGISFSLLYLLIFIDINYFLYLPLSFVLWFFTLCIIITSCVMYNSFNFNYQLQNINKWNSAADRLQYSAGLRVILSQKKSISSLSYLQGYNDIHFQKCQLSHCPYRFNQQSLNRIRIFRKNKNLLDSQIKMQQLIIRIYSEGIKYFPNIPTLNIQFAIFYYERNMKQRALKYLLASSIKNMSLEQCYKFYRLRKILHDELTQQQQNTLDLLTQMQMRDLQEQFLRSVQKSSLSDMQLWSILLQDHPDFGKLDKVGGERVKIGQHVRNLYTRITQKGNSQKITALYVQYLINVCKQNGNFTDVEDIIKNKYVLNEKIVIFDWVNSSQPSFVISGQQNTFGQINDLNLSAAILLGYQKSQLINRKLSFIMPFDFVQRSEQFISLKQNNKQFYLLRKDNYIIKIKRRNYISSSIMKGSIFISTIQPIPINPLSCKILVQTQSPFNIIGMQSNAISFFGIQMRQNDPISIAQISQVIFNSLEDEICLHKQFLLSEIISSHVVKRMKATDQELNQQFIIKTTHFNQDFIQIQFLKKKPKSIPKALKVKINQFKFEPVLVDGGLVYSNNLTTQYEYLANKMEIESEKSIVQKQNKINYGKGIRTVRLDYDQIQIIEELSQSEQSQPKSQPQLVNNFGITIQTSNKGNYKNILQSNESIRQFVLNNNIGKTNKIMLVIATFISIMWFIVIYFVFRQNHNGIVQDLKQYVDQNLKLGQIQDLNVLVVKAALMQQNKSNLTSTIIIQQIQQQLKQLQIKKAFGHVYPIDTLMLDGTPQRLSNIQYIDSLNSNIQDLLTSLINGSTISNSIINFSINNEKLIQPQVINHLINWHSSIQSSFTKSILIESIIFVLFIIVESLILAFLIYKVVKMFNDKICVLKIFLEISEQNIRIMSIKTEQFLNTLYNNETDIDDQETIIRKTNNKHTFAIKKKFKLIKRNVLIYVILGGIFLLLISFAVGSFAVSSDNLLFKKRTLSFINTTSGGTSFFYHHLHGLQMKILKQENYPTPAYLFIIYYKDMLAHFYQSFSGNIQFSDFWTSIMMQNICSGRLKLEYTCSTPSTKFGAVALITDLVLNTLSLRSFATDFSSTYYNFFKAFKSVHQSLSINLLSAFDKIVNGTLKLLMILLIVAITTTPILLLIIGLKAINTYTQEIDKTRRMLSLLPIQCLRSCQSINQFLDNTVNRKQWILF